MSVIPFVGCTFCHCIMVKSFLRKVAGVKMLMLELLQKHNFGHKKDIYALGWHVVGSDGEILLRWSGSLA